MKLRLLLTSLVFALIISPFARAEGGDASPLEKEMKTLNKAFRQLKKQAGDSTQNASSLTLVSQMEKAAAASTALVPEKAAELPEKDRAAMVAAYKEKMEKFSASLAKVEAALKAGDNATAVKLVADLGTQQREGHKEFRKPQD